MRNLLLIIASFAVTIVCWGLYGPVLHFGQEGMFSGPMDAPPPHLARWRPFVCVGMAYFAIGVIVPATLLYLRGEKGHWSMTGIIWSLAGGAAGALGALGIILAFTFGGSAIYVMPLVFGGAPVVNSFLTIVWAKKLKEVGPLFLAGLVIVLLGAVTVLIFSPTASGAKGFNLFSMNSVWQLLSISMVILCWGAYGPVLHKGQAAMDHSRLRPLLCVGLAYFAIAVVVPNMLLVIPNLAETSSYSFPGTLWSLGAGAAGAIGALGIIMAFNFGGKPVFVMPLIFGGAPVVNVLFSAINKGKLGDLSGFFIAGLILSIAGSAMVLVFAPRGGRPGAKPSKHAEPVKGKNTPAQPLTDK
ncbi:hypothetical protein [Aeoliella mucimassa]|uniref:EamA-like transporter family protein n=1 Tax=Aeoliella mucimassa TaxID=2527972 RepID=A0A518AMP5_9BACT|nr:hypothetical protein [Aeoliella mucimassa]QDU55961.1 hypothetical protein Pan181_21630 [Aeoliella mucimassa]